MSINKTKTFFTGSEDSLVGAKYICSPISIKLKNNKNPKYYRWESQVDILGGVPTAFSNTSDTEVLLETKRNLKELREKIDKVLTDLDSEIAKRTPLTK